MFNLEQLLARKHSQDFDFCSGNGITDKPVKEKKKGNKAYSDNESVSDYDSGYTRFDNYADPTQPGRDMTIMMGDS